MNLKNYILVIFLASLLPFNCFTQKNIIDSLNSKFGTSNDTTKVQILNRVVELTLKSNPKKAKILADSALVFAEKIHYKLGIANSYRSLANVQTTIGEYDNAIVNLRKAIDLYTGIRSNEGIIISYNVLGNTYLGLKELDKALDNYTKGNEIAKQAPQNRKMIGYTNAGIANVLVEKGKYEASLPYLLESETIFLEFKSHSLVGYIRSMIANCYIQMNRLDEAEEYILAINPFFIANRDEYALMQNYYSLGVISEKRNNIPKAINQINSALKIALKRQTWDDIQKSAFKLSQLHEKNNDAVQALRCMKIYTQYKDSFVNKDRNSAIAQAEAKFQFKDKEQQLKLKNLELNASNLKLQNRNILIYIFLAIVSIMAVLVFFIVKQSQQKMSANALLTKQKVIIEEKSQLVAIKNEEIVASINYARRIQKAILPSFEQMKKMVPNHFVSYLPKDIVAGDFYWLQEINGRIFLAVADCTGHGVPGAMMSVVCSNALNRVVREFQIHDPGEILTKTRELIISEMTNSDTFFSDGMDISLCSFNTTKFDGLLWSGANIPLWIYRKSTDSIEVLQPDKQPIGNGINKCPFNTHFVTVSKEDRVFLRTDGFQDQFGGELGKKIMSKRFKEVLRKTSSSSLQEQQREIESFFLSWKGNNDQIDDVCVLGFSV